MRGKIGSALAAVALSLLLFGGVAVGQEQKFGNGKAEDGKWLILCYWELNPNMPVMEHVGIAKKLTEAGLFPPQGVRILRFDKTAADWGIVLFEADSPRDAFEVVNLWRVAGTGFFKEVKVSPAMPVRDASMHAVQLFQAIKGAEAAQKK